jgi:uncharacterized protein (DUF1499 family)
MPEASRSRTLRLIGLALAVGAIGAVALSAFGYRQGWWSVSPALTISEYAVYAAGLGFLLSAAALVHWARRRQAGVVPATLGLLAALPILAMAIGWEYATRTTPPINDISTDTDDPPVFWNTPMPTDYPSQNAEPQRAAYPEVAPLEVGKSPEEVFAQALALVRERGWEILAEDETEGRIEAVATSFLYGFKDEIAIRVTRTEMGARVDVRSRSRIGRIDRGANARRIRAFLDDLASRPFARSGEES